MNSTFNGLLAGAGISLITHVGLVGPSGTELSGGAYARKPVVWAAGTSATRLMATNLTFDVPAGATVAGWSGFSALTGGTEYGGNSLTQQTYATAGQYLLHGATTGITVT